MPAAGMMQRKAAVSNRWSRQSAEWFDLPAFRSCAFINVAAELDGSQLEVLTIALLLPGLRRQTTASAAVLAVDDTIVRAQLEP